MRLVAIVGTYDDVEKYFELAGLEPDYFFCAEHDGTRYVGHHASVPDFERYDEVIDLCERAA